MSFPDLDSAFHGSVTVGERGQVVIPAGAREKLGISAGDKLLVFSHPTHCGVLFAKLQDLQRMTEMLEPILREAGDLEGAGRGSASDEASSGQGVAG